MTYDVYDYGPAGVNFSFKIIECKPLCIPVISINILRKITADGIAPRLGKKPQAVTTIAMGRFGSCIIVEGYAICIVIKSRLTIRVRKRGLVVAM